MIEYGGPNWEYNVYLSNLKENVAYTLVDQTDAGVVRLIPEGEEFNGKNSFNVALDALKFLINNNLIHVKGFKVTASGRVASIEEFENELDLNELRRLKRLIHQDEYKRQQKLKEDTNQKRQLEEIEKQKELEKRAKRDKIPIIGNILNLMDQFSEPSSAKVSKSKNKSISEALIGDLSYNSPNLGARRFHRGLINVLGDEKDKKELQKKYK